MIMRNVLLASIIVALVGTSPLAAQSESDVNAYFTLIGTPSGGLPPVLSSAMLNRSMTSPNVAVRYGHISTVGTGFNNFAATLGIPAGPKAVFGVTAGPSLGGPQGATPTPGGRASGAGSGESSPSPGGEPAASPSPSECASTRSRSVIAESCSRIARSG